jgi:DNA polymerase-3 subunit chi
MIVNFYKLQRENFIKTICQLIEKSYDTEYKVLVKTNDHIYENEINRTLWTYSQKTFIPHGSSKDPLPDIHPVYITSLDENPNGANLKILIDNFEFTSNGFEKLLYIFAEDLVNLEESEKLYNKYIEKKFEVSYYIQGNKGWSKL